LYIQGHLQGHTSHHRAIAKPKEGSHINLPDQARQDDSFAGGGGVAGAGGGLNMAIREYMMQRLSKVAYAESVRKGGGGGLMESWICLGISWRRCLLRRGCYRRPWTF